MLRRAGDARVAAQARSYFKPHESIRVHGVAAPRVRAIEKELFAKVRGAWTAGDALRFCEILVEEGSHESKSIGFHLLRRYQGEFDRRLIGAAESWLSGDLCDNWAAVDDLCPCVITPLVRRFPGLIPRVRRWSRSPNLWLRRASAVTFVPMARKGERLDAAYGVAASLLGDREDLIHKAAGWLLREAGRTDSLRLETFLLTHGPKVPRTTLRYAIERLPEKKRRRILAATRAR